MLMIATYHRQHPCSPSSTSHNQGDHYAVIVANALATKHPSSLSSTRRNYQRRVSLSETNNDYDGPKRTTIVRITATPTTTTAAAASSATASSTSLNAIESWCITHMDVLYSKSLSIKCPFIRRRTADFLDGIDMVMRFLIIRHKSLPLIGPPPGCRSLYSKTQFVKKSTNLRLEDIIEIIRHDWRPHTMKGYYITGRLNTTIYRDDCFFDGPDPDMPVKGLRKYLNAASQLFDTAASTAELLSLEIVEPKDDNDYSGRSSSTTNRMIVAHWKLQGVLHLPWHPTLPVWTGKTMYHFDEEHLIYKHEEFWDISVVEAFTQTLFPQIASKIYGNSKVAK
jgi:hypothetical protein